jgi:hypothetical protein
LRNPLSALPSPVLAALASDNELVEENIAYRVRARLYPRRPERLQPLLASMRLQEEISRLLNAVKENRLKIYWQPQ